MRLRGTVDGSTRGLVGSLIAVSVASLVWASVPAGASPTFASQSAAEIMATARSAMKGEGSVSADANGLVGISGVGNAHLSEQNYAGAKSGTEVSMFTSTSSKTPLPSASVTLVNGALYIYANQAFWAAPKITAVQSASLSFKWIQVPRSNPRYVDEAGDLTMSTLIRDLFTAKSYQKGGVRTVDGIRVIQISYTTTGVDAGSTSALISVSGKHLPVSVSLDGVPFQFTSWAKTKAISAPKGAVSYSSLVP